MDHASEQTTTSQQEQPAEDPSYPANQLAENFRAHVLSLSQPEKAHQQVRKARAKVCIMKPMTESAQTELANNAYEKLGEEDSPANWHGNGEVWVKWQRHRAYDLKKKVTDVKKYVEYTAVDQLCEMRQNRAYQGLLQDAKPSQVPHYYKLHCQRLEEAKVDNGNYAKASRQYTMREQRFLLRKYAHWHRCSNDKGRSKSDKKEMEKYIGQNYSTNAKDRLYVRGIEDLIERCERRLREDSNFVPVNRRPIVGRKRWEEGRKGWTGLSEEKAGKDVTVTDAELLGEDSGEEDAEDDAMLRV